MSKASSTHSLKRSIRSIISRNRRVPSSLVLGGLCFFVVVAFFQQNWIQNSPYYLFQKHRELLSLSNTQAAINYDNSSSTSTKISPTSCSPSSNIVFLKTHKCASSTIQNIFMRYGFSNHKVFVLPPKANYLGHPALFHPSMVPKPSHFGHEYNILTHHSRLNYLAMRSLMPKDTLFITIVRNPIDLFESMFHYYKLERFWNFTLEDLDRDDFKIPIKLLTDRWIGKIGINQMLFDLGLNISDFANPTSVKKNIERFDRIFDLVMIAERMEESLVLLRHLLCWQIDDVVVFKLNARQTQFKSNLTETARMKIKTINWADHLLYRHFLTKFDESVNLFGTENMRREVEELRTRTNEWYDHCVQNANEQSNELTTKRTKTDANHRVVRLINKNYQNITCWLLTAQELDFTKFLRMRQMKMFPGSVFLTDKRHSRSFDKNSSNKQKEELENNSWNLKRRNLNSNT